jgi:hypothetical protein
MTIYEVPPISSPKIIEKEVAVRYTGMKYRVLKYDEKYVCDDDVKTGIYRSVIYTDDGGLVCYSSPKGVPIDVFRENHPNIGSGRDILVTEVVEGTMISLFWDDRIGGWELATKGSVAGNYWFYRTQYESQKETQKTFRDMFLEVFHVDDLKSEVFSLFPRGDEKSRICYNFVLQHPDNHIIQNIQHPRLVLVSVYGIHKDAQQAECILYDVYKEWNVWQELSGMVGFPNEFQGLDAIEAYGRILQSTSGPLPGLMFLDKKTGERACLENPAYNELKELRGNNPNLHYQYLCLLRIGKVADFLTHFPQYKRLFGRFRQQWDIFVTNIHQAYMTYYIKPCCPGPNEDGRPQISKRYFPLIYKLHHEVYLPSLSQTKIIMKRPVVFKHLLEFPPSTLFHYLYMKDITE